MYIADEKDKGMYQRVKEYVRRFHMLDSEERVIAGVSCRFHMPSFHAYRVEPGDGIFCGGGPCASRA